MAKKSNVPFVTGESRPDKNFRAAISRLNALIAEFNAHAANHQYGGSDAIKLDDLAMPDDNTKLNVSTTTHGLMPKLPDDTMKCFWGHGPGGNWAAGIKVMYRYGYQDYSNSSAELAIIDLPVPAGMLGDDRIVRITVSCRYKNNTGSNQTITIRFKYGSTTVYDDISLALSSTSTKRPVLFSLLFRNLVSNNQRFGGSISIGLPGGCTAGQGDIGIASPAIDTPVTGVSTEDSTQALNLQLTIQHSAASTALSLEREIAFIELI